MGRKKKSKIEFRYYRMPEDAPFLALLGEKWVQHYGKDVDYLHFHNYMEIGYCYNGTGTLVLGEENYRFTGDQFSVIPKNYPHTTDSDPDTLSKWEYLFVDVDMVLEQFYWGGVSIEKRVFLTGSTVRRSLSRLRNVLKWRR